MSSVITLDHVQLAAPPGCEQAAREFFGQLLGLREVDKPSALRASGGAWFELAQDRELHVGVTEPFVPADKAHPGLRVPDEAALHDLARRLGEAGIAITWDDAIPGVPRFFTSDPWGNRLEFRA
jgi:catechol 2,3-dioxygenase-like lactoylglutathione lyase family enzyme